MLEGTQAGRCQGAGSRVPQRPWARDAWKEGEQNGWMRKPWQNPACALPLSLASSYRQAAEVGVSLRGRNGDILRQQASACQAENTHVLPEGLLLQPAACSSAGRLEFLRGGQAPPDRSEPRGPLPISSCPWPVICRRRARHPQLPGAPPAGVGALATATRCSAGWRQTPP